MALFWRDSKIWRDVKLLGVMAGDGEENGDTGWCFVRRFTINLDWSGGWKGMSGCGVVEDGERRFLLFFRML